VLTLLEIQRAIHRALVSCEDGEACAQVIADGIPPSNRLAVYRNTFASSLTNALRIAYPAVHRLVGAEFFDGAAAGFIEETPPRTAWLDAYGDAFPDYLARFPQAASVPYLADVGRLELAVNKALHADDALPLDVTTLTRLPPLDRERVRFAPHPSLSLIQTEYPADTIWRSVLADDEAALAAIDLAAGSAWLLVERTAEGVEVRRMIEAAWRFTAALCAGQALQAALDASPDIDAPLLLADHLASGRFTDVAVGDVADREPSEPDL